MLLPYVKDSKQADSFKEKLCQRFEALQEVSVASAADFAAANKEASAAAAAAAAAADVTGADANAGTDTDVRHGVAADSAAAAGGSGAHAENGAHAESGVAAISPGVDATEWDAGPGGKHRAGGDSGVCVCVCVCDRGKLNTNCAVQGAVFFHLATMVVPLCSIHTYNAQAHTHTHTHTHTYTHAQAHT